MTLSCTTEARDVLIARGATVASARIIVDVSRIYGLAFTVWSKATHAQKDALVGFSPELLGIAVAQAIALRELTSDTDDAGHVDTVLAQASAASAIAAFSRGLPRRDHLHTMLRGVAGSDPELPSRVDVAVGTVEDAESLAKGIKRLVAIGREALGHKKDAIAVRVKLGRLSAVYLEGTDTLANEVLRTGRAASGRATARRTSQGEVDFLDGVNLLLLSTIIAAFEAAHDLDASIPRLVPIATRRALGKSRRAKTGKASAEEKGGASKGDEGEGATEVQTPA